MMLRHRWALLPCLLGLFSTPGHAGEAENWQRLRSMPRERRLELGENLKQFDLMDSAERSAIRGLDAELAKRPPADQAHYRQVLRRYHLWVNTLSEDQREQLRRASPGQERMAVVAKLRRAEKKSDPVRIATPLAVQLLPTSPVPPLELAKVLRIWLELTPAQRASIERLNLLPGPFVAQVIRTARSGLPKGKSLELFPSGDEEALLQEMESTLAKSRELAAFKGLLESSRPAAGEKRAEKTSRFRRQLAESYYFVKHPPERVAGTNLVRFEEVLPAWLRSAQHALPDDEVRRRLTVLYRLVYPHPQEMPQPKPATAAPKKKAPAPATAPAKKGSTAPKPAPPPKAKPLTPPSSSGTPF